MIYVLIQESFASLSPLITSFLTPCKHQLAKCISLNNYDYKCICPEGYTGKKCEIYYSACESKPCRNDAFCSSEDGYKYSCYCKPGYFGDLCEHRKDYCKGKNPCFNNGVCTMLRRWNLVF